VDKLPIVKKLKIWCPIRGGAVTVDECLKCQACLPEPILRKLFKDVEHEPNRYGVTELVSPCIRKSFFARTSNFYPSLKDLYILGRGNAFHNWFNEMFQGREIKLVKHFKDFSIIGIVDGYHETKEGIVLYEIKSVTRIPLTPYPHHVTQIQAYYSLAKENMEIDKLELIYLGMNDFARFQVEKKNVLPFLVERAKILHKALQENKPPSIQDTTQCFYCPFRARCQLVESVKRFKKEFGGDSVERNRGRKT